MTLHLSSRTEFIRSQRAKARVFRNQTGRFACGASAGEGSFIYTPQQIGKYLVSPLIRLADTGRYAASVSIRSGRGSMTHDRVMRFVPQFDSPDQASRFATAQALAWIGLPALVAAPSTLTSE